MAGGKKYGVYVKKGARGKVRARAAVNRINKKAGSKVAKVVKQRKNADAVVGIKKKLVNKDAIAETAGGRPDRISVQKDWAKWEAAPVNKTAAKNTLVHEITHGLGFNHRSEKASEKKPFNTMSIPVVGSNLSKKQVTKVKKRVSKNKYGSKPTTTPFQRGQRG